MSKEFDQRVKRTLTPQEISGLRAYRASAPGGNVLFIPRVKRYGQEVVWEARAHIKGAMGPVHATTAALQAIGAPEDWAEKVPTFLTSLQEQYPTLPALFPEKNLPTIAPPDEAMVPPAELKTS